MSGKGSWYRPVNKSKYDENYDRIFKEEKSIVKLFREENPDALPNNPEECDVSEACVRAGMLDCPNCIIGRKKQ